LPAEYQDKINQMPPNLTTVKVFDPNTGQVVDKVVSYADLTNAQYANIPGYTDNLTTTPLGTMRQNYPIYLGGTIPGTPGYTGTGTTGTGAGAGAQEYTTPNYMYPGMEPITDRLQYIRETPGYQFQFDEGMRALERSAAARGMLQSGQLIRQSQEYGQNIGSQYYQNYLNQLAGLWGGGYQSAAGTAAGAQQGATQAAQAQAGIGQALGSGYAQAAQAQQNAAIAQAQQPTMLSQIFGGASGLGSLALGVGALASGFGWSDSRTKEDIHPMNALAAVSKLKPVNFRYKKEFGGGGTRAGFVADDVEKVFPAAVHREPRTGLRMIDPMAMNALAIGAIQEMQNA